MMIRNRNLARLLALSALAGTTLSGCATVASSYPTNRAAPNAKAAGPVYNLPVKAMSVSVGSNRFGLFVAVHDVRIEGDASAAYVLDYRPDSASADGFDVGVDPATGLLSTVKVEADSKAAEAITALARSAGQFAGAFESGRSGLTRLYAIRQLTYWPSAATRPEEAAAGLARLNAEINGIVADVVRVHGCGLKDEAVLAAGRRAATCDATGRLIPGAVPPVTLAIDYTPFRSRTGAADCSVGICTRQQVPAAMQLSTAGSVDSARVPLPNGSDPVPLPLRRVAFTKATTEYTLVDGLLTKMAFDKGAELPAIFALPGSLIGAFVGGVVDGGLQAANRRKARTDTAASKAAAAEAREAAADKAAADEAGAGQAGAGQEESSRPGVLDATFEAGLVMIVYPLPQLGAELGELQSAGGAAPLPQAEPAGGLGNTTPPGPNPVKEK